MEPAETAKSTALTSWQRVRQVARAIGPAALVITVVEITLSVFLASKLSDSDRVEQLVRDAGLWAPLVFVLLMALLVPINVPGIVFVIPAASIFGLPSGILLSLAGGFIASTIGMLAARHLAREALRRRLPDWLISWEAGLAERAFWRIVILRAVTFLTQPVDWICGLSSIPMRTALPATLLGLIAPTIVIASTGSGLIGLIT